MGVCRVPFRTQEEGNALVVATNNYMTPRLGPLFLAKTFVPDLRSLKLNC